MAGPLRSKHGCWTCRLRKKKCDEGRPQCSTCESLAITCHGYGPKPDWMDGGESERTIANDLKETVKHTSRRKYTGSTSNLGDHIVPIAPKSQSRSVEGSSTTTGLSSRRDTSSPSNSALLHENDVKIVQDGVAVSLSIQHLFRGNSNHIKDEPTFNHTKNESMFPSSAGNAVLLMNFLDNVFPLEFPLYRPEILEGGRGWLLALLLRTEPLYHTALAFSAYHRRTILDAKMSQPRQIAAVVQQEKHLQICIQMLNQSAHNSCTISNKLGIATSVIQLVFFEV
jgi:hypothetical protein